MNGQTPPFANPVILNLLKAISSSAKGSVRQSVESLRGCDGKFDPAATRISSYTVFGVTYQEVIQ